MFLDYRRKLILLKNISSGYELVQELNFLNLPQVSVSEDFGGGEEDIEFENNEILFIDDNGIKIAAGGDWQDPIIFTATYDNGFLTCNNDAMPVVNWPEGLPKQVLFNIIFENNIPQEVRDYI
jgi:hypothetical protein